MGVLTLSLKYKFVARSAFLFQNVLLIVAKKSLVMQFRIIRREVLVTLVFLEDIS